MALMEWNDKMSVGIDSIDAQHKKLVALLNELYDGVQQGHTKEALGTVLSGLVDYTVAHFKYEEDLFAKTGYAEKDAHKAEHDAFTRKVGDVQEKYKTGVNTSLSLEVMTFLKNWLTNHIMGTDQKYTAHLKANGVA